jgi:hypothetical protein
VPHAARRDFPERTSNPYFIAVFLILFFARAISFSKSICVSRATIARASSRVVAWNLRARVHLSLSGVAVFSIVL